VKYTGKDPDQLIAERKRQLQSKDEDIRYIAEETLKNFLLDLEKKKMKCWTITSTIETYTMRVETFINEKC